MKDPYFEMRGLSNSMLRWFKKSPEHYWHAISNEPEFKAYNAFGRALHTLVLEPHLFERDVFIFDETKRPVPDKNYQTKANREWKEEQFKLAIEQEKDLISAADFDHIQRMRDKLYKDPVSSPLLEFTRNRYEQIHTWKLYGINCKCKVDIENDLFNADLKGLIDVDPDEFRQKIFRHGYYRQGGMYTDGTMGGLYNFRNPPDFYFIGVEKQPPYGVSVIRLREEVINYGVEEYRHLVRRFAACRGDYGVSYSIKAPFGNDGIFDVGLPYYLR